MRELPFSAQEGKEGSWGLLVAQQEQERQQVEEEDQAALFWPGVRTSLSGGGGNSNSNNNTGGSKRRQKSSSGVEEGLEPRSVLDQRRSPSPPTSSSTLSSSLGGGGGDIAGVAAVSGNNPSTPKWDVAGGIHQRRDEWAAADLQPIAAGLEMAAGFIGTGEKCAGIIGVDDWDAMLSETAASPAHEQSFLRWIMGEADDPAALGITRQQQPQPLISQLVGAEFDGGANVGLGFGIPDLDAVGIASAAAAISPLSLSSEVTSAGGLSLSSNTANSNKLSNSNSNFATHHQSGNLLNPLLLSPQPQQLPLPQGLFFPEPPPMEEKPQLLGAPSFMLNQHQHQQQQPQPSPNHPSFFFPLPSFTVQAEHHPPPPPPPLLLPPQPKRHHPDPEQLLLRRNHLSLHQPPTTPTSFPLLHPTSALHLPMRPKAEDSPAAHHHHHHQQAILDQLFEAARIVETGDHVGARGILARLNQQLPSAMGKPPLLRSAYYFKQALNHILADPATAPFAPSSGPHRSAFSTPLATPHDVAFKLAAYKEFSEVSPVLQFANFTATQALLEELGPSADRIHIIDFDIGVGGQWSSFMQELAQSQSRRCTTSASASGAAAAGTAPLLKLTAFVSPSSYHPLELQLTHDNLTHFAAELQIPFEFNILPLDSFDPTAELLSMGKEAIAVNLPIGCGCGHGHGHAFPTLLRLVKRLSPKIVISIDHSSDRGELPFGQHFIQAFYSCSFLLDSIDSSGISTEITNRIEHFLLQPRIEKAIIGRHSAASKMMPWRTLFTSAGFVPVHFSNFAETQAECLLKRVQVRGFHVEKRQSSLSLYWQRGELVSVSAWRC